MVEVNDDDAPSGLRNPSRRRFTLNLSCFSNRVPCEEPFSPLTGSGTLSRKYRVGSGSQGGASQFVEAGEGRSQNGSPQNRHRREPGTEPLFRGGVGTDFPLL